MADRGCVEAARIPWRTLGELFVQRGLVTPDDLESALEEQAQTDRRLGEILVERGLVSAADLRQALMEQLGVEISEESFGSSLWAEIKRRHESEHTDEEHDGEPEPQPESEHTDEEHDTEPEPEPEPESESQPEPEPESQPEPESEPELVEIEPVEIEPAVLELARAEPEEVSQPLDIGPRDDDETAMLRAELEQARLELTQLREMLADSMTALSALIAEGATPASHPDDEV